MNFVGGLQPFLDSRLGNSKVCTHGECTSCRWNTSRSPQPECLQTDLSRRLCCQNISPIFVSRMRVYFAVQMSTPWLKAVTLKRKLNPLQKVHRTVDSVLGSNNLTRKTFASLYLYPHFPRKSWWQEPPGWNTECKKKLFCHCQWLTVEEKFIEVRSSNRAVN